tara:strand:+ start:1021 stop:1854 length:834 start_codon:yes stop_codon:yes gene_type:complete
VKLKHNKKRNTALIYEALMRELTKAVTRKNHEVKEKIITLVKEHFGKNTLMAKELKLYQVLGETYDLEPHMAEKMIFEIRKLHQQIDKKELFNEQSRVINKINQVFGGSFFSNFVPNYKTLATINNIFNSEVPTKKRLVLEEKLVQKLASKKDEEHNMKPVDQLTFKTFIKNFNTEYARDLYREQRNLLSKYIMSFADNGLELKVYLNEEIARLKGVVKDSLKTDEIRLDNNMLEKTQKVLEMLNNFRNEKIQKPMVENVLKIQNLAREIVTDVNRS